MKGLWAKFDQGDHITDAELDALITQAEKGLEYLEARGPSFRLATVPTYQALDRLKGYKYARKESR